MYLLLYTCSLFNKILYLKLFGVSYIWFIFIGAILTISFSFFISKENEKK